MQTQGQSEVVDSYPSPPFRNRCYVVIIAHAHLAIGADFLDGLSVIYSPDAVAPCDLEVFPAGRAETDQGGSVSPFPGRARHALFLDKPRLAHTA